VWVTGCGATIVIADDAGCAAPEPPPRGETKWWQRVRPAVVLVVGGVSLYLLLPSLLSVFRSWRSLSHLDWRFAVLALACETASYVCLWEVDRIALGTRAWFAVAAAQLGGSAVGHVLPGGGATSTAATASMLRRAGVAEPGEAATAFGAAAVLQMATTFVLPVFALPAILGSAAINHSLETAAYLGAAVLVALLAGGTAAFLGDKPLELAGRAIQWLLNATVRRRKHVTDIPQRLLADRDFVRAKVGRRWKTTLWAAAGNTAFDYFALLAALHAVGADPRPSLVLLAYVAGELLALLPFTPGGLGFVETGLVGTLTVAGVPSGDALAATLLYRIIAYWLPLLAGGVAYFLFRHRYGSSSTWS
jgi:uncharacterized protein (TIRG00374 family)